MVEEHNGDLLGSIRAKTERLLELRRQVEALEAELGQIRQLVGALDPQRPRTKSRHGFTGGQRSRPIVEHSSIWWAQKVLAERMTPLTVEELTEAIRVAGGPAVRKPTLVSNLSRYVKFRDTFVRTARNTYGLLPGAESKEVSAT